MIDFIKKAWVFLAGLAISTARWVQDNPKKALLIATLLAFAIFAIVTAAFPPFAFVGATIGAAGIQPFISILAISSLAAQSVAVGGVFAALTAAAGATYLIIRGLGDAFLRWRAVHDKPNEFPYESELEYDPSSGFESGFGPTVDKNIANNPSDSSQKYFSEAKIITSSTSAVRDPLTPDPLTPAPLPPVNKSQQSISTTEITSQKILVSNNRNQFLGSTSDEKAVESDNDELYDNEETTNGEQPSNLGLST